MEALIVEKDGPDQRGHTSCCVSQITCRDDDGDGGGGGGVGGAPVRLESRRQQRRWRLAASLDARSAESWAMPVTGRPQKIKTPPKGVRRGKVIMGWRPFSERREGAYQSI
jgi:hypothetical protein